MCVAAFAWDAHPEWRLVAVGNRDEYHDRPAAPLAQWDDPAGIIAGRDLKSGGTWLGVSEIGQFVLVTNLRGYGEPDPARQSRGELVTRLLSAEAPPQDLDIYNPFNIIHADPSGAGFLTNRPEDTRAKLSRGVYGLSNGRLDEPWAKTLQLKAALLDWLVQDGDSCEPLFKASQTDNLAEMGLHPLAPSDIPMEANETPIFIRNPVYGTRCSTVVTIDRRGRGRIMERRFNPQGEKSGETALEFCWPA